MMKIFNRTSLFVVLCLMLISIGCATYYKKTQKFQEYITNGEMGKAKELLENDKKAQDGINRLLYLFNDGWVNWMLADYDQSNTSLNEADHMIEDQHKKLGLELLALFTNPTVKPYQPEDFEVVFVNYFKALNYLALGKYDDALVECRRMNILLYQLNDKYKEKKNRYSDDAFAHVIIGLIYEASNNYNDAFIAYRNALEAYEKIYKENFNTVAPEQLKKDLIRSASLSGLRSDQRQYEDQFKMRYEPKKDDDSGELVFIWQNGFGPVKAEWSINFTILEGQGGMVTFANEELGLSFPFYIGDLSGDEKTKFSDLNFIRIAFPKYLERTPVFTSGKVATDNADYPLEMAENVNNIAFKTLQDRMLREMANSLLRLAVKKAMEQAAREENKDVGAAISIINALTEKADTRNWQTLPYSISYVRVPLPEGKHSLTFEANSGAGVSNHTFEVDIKKGQTLFYTYQSIETNPPSDSE